MKSKRPKSSIRFVSLTLLFALLVMLLPVPAHANPDPGWYDASWKYRKTITFTSDSGKIPSTQSNFPVLISFGSDSDLAADAQDDGDDILFTSSDATTKLSHELEKFNGDTGELVAWVKVTSLSTSTVIYLYYGNASCSSQQSVSAVWDSNFKAVWHLKETSGTHYDSTSNDNDGTPNGGVTQGTTGKVNGADSFDGSNDYVSVPYSSNLDPSTVISVDCWFKAPASQPGADANNVVQIVDNSHGQWNGWVFIIDIPTGKLRWAIMNGVNWYYDAWSISSVLDNDWHHAAGLLDGNQIKFYIDGALQGTTPVTTYALSTGRPINLGAWWGGGAFTRFFNGLIDEVRISDTARSADWIKTEYSNQSDPSNFYSLGSETKNWESYRDSGSPPTTVWGSAENPYSSTYHTVYMYGEGFTSGHSYSIGFYDNGGTKSGSDVIGSLSGTNLSCEFELSTRWTSAAGLWHAVVFDNASPPATYAECSGTSGYTVEDDLQVGADAIPEFPSFFSAIGVSGLCFGIYYLIRKRQMQASPRTS